MRPASPGLIPASVAIPLLGAAACWALQPLHPDLPVLVWTLLGAATLAAGLLRLRSPEAAGLRANPQSPAPDPGLQRGLRLWLALAMVGCAIDAIWGLAHGEGVRTMRQDGKLGLMALMLLVLLPVLRSSARSGPVTARALATALLGAVVLQMLVACTVAATWPRSELPATAIPWATLVALGLALLAPLLLPASRCEADSALPSNTASLFKAMIALALLAGIAAVLFSRSRSAWLVLPWLGLLAVWGSRRRLPAAVAVTTLSLALLALGLAYDLRQPEQLERGLRLLDLLDELRTLDMPDAGTSSGSRWLLWQAAWNSLWAHPWSGIGMEARIALVQHVVPPGLLPQTAALVHVHQQYLNQAVDHGLAGLMASLLSAAGPIALALAVRGVRLRWQLAGIAGVHAAGLLFNANMTHGAYAFGVAVAMGLAVVMHQLHQERQA